MPNILLTEKCVRSCPYCFAKKQMGESDHGSLLKWEDLIYLADSFIASGCHEMRFLGGEPALHPAFADFVAYVLERDFSVLVFTSGIIPEKAADGLRFILKTVPNAEKRVSFLCNVNDPKLSPPNEVAAVERFLEEFGGQTSLGFNIYRLDFTLDFMFRYINSYGLKRNIRLGLTHPILRENNTFIAIKDMPEVMTRLCGYLKEFHKLDIVPGFDCGFPMCLFSDEQLGQLYKAAPGSLRFSCGAPLDIGPDMMSWACFPLSGTHKKSFYEFNSLREAEQFYSSFLKDIRVESGGIFDKCDNCIWRDKQVCQGGCVAHLLREIDREGNLRLLKI